MIKNFSTLAAALSIGLLANQASAATVTVSYTQFNTNQTALALGARDTFIGGGIALSEDFEGFMACPAVGCDSGTISTSVGTFTGISPSHTGGASQVIPKDQIVVRTSTPAPYGRVNVTPGGKNWLDSNDMAGILWNLVLPATQYASKIAFILSDIDDVGDIRFTITVAGNEISPVTASRPGGNAGGIGDGRLHVVMMNFAGATSDVSISMLNGKGDGFGIDGIRVAAVPLPAGGLLLIGALGGLAALRRRKAQTA